MIDLPAYLPSFDPDQDGCEINAAFCCWVQDRQANDNNGNCNDPYESQCIDKDPGDNANFCYTDHARSSPSTHVAGGFSIFGDVVNDKENIEGPIHCHGFAWAQDDTDISGIYKGNNLFYISLYDHMYQRGYVRNAPGSSMCACAENMAVVTRSDCTEIAADETFEFTFTAATGTFSGTLTETNIEFNACQGANGNNNDLDAYYERLVDEGKQTQENLDFLRTVLVGDTPGQCNAAIVNFLGEKGIFQDPGAAMAAMPDELIAAAPGDNNGKKKEKVEVIDPDLLNASGGGNNMKMPDVPYDPAMDVEDAPYVGPTDNEPSVVDVVDDTPENNFEDENNVIDDEDDEEEDQLKADGEDCELDGECLSGKCLGNKTCGKDNGGGNKQNKKPRTLKKTWWK
jgi:hypothetical protein